LVPKNRKYLIFVIFRARPTRLAAKRAASVGYCLGEARMLARRAALFVIGYWLLTISRITDNLLSNNNFPENDFPING